MWKWWFSLSILLSLLLFSSSSVNSTGFAEQFFDSVDKDKDGDVDVEELRKALQEVGGEHFDENDEVEVGVRSAFTVDTDQDLQLLQKDLISHWVTFATIMNPSKLGDWISHAVGLSDEIAHTFVKANWTGLDLPRLINGNIDKVLGELNLKLIRADKLKLVGAVKLRMLGVGTTPNPPELKVSEATPSAKCGTVVLSWSRGRQRALPEIHKYRLYRRVARDNDEPDDEWFLIYDGGATAFTDRGRDDRLQFDYKIEAWNLVGCSEGYELHDVTPSQRGCNTANWFFGLLNFLIEIRMLSVNASGAFLLFYFYFYVPYKESSKPRLQSSVSRDSLGSRSGGQIRTIRSETSNVSDDVSFDDQVFAQDQVFLPERESFGNDSRTNRTNHQRRLANGTSFNRREYSSNRCSECGKSVTRTSRHQCGACLHVFCIQHTAIHPHINMFGKVVISTCGINSKCRCYPCAGLTPKLDCPQPSDVSDESSSSKLLWKTVKQDVLLRRVIRIWRRKEEIPSTKNSEKKSVEPSRMLERQETREDSSLYHNVDQMDMIKEEDESQPTEKDGQKH